MRKNTFYDKIFTKRGIVYMKKGLKIFGYSLAGISALAYLSFLFILPNAVDINKFKPEIQKIAKEQANLSINFENAKTMLGK